MRTKSKIGVVAVLLLAALLLSVIAVAAFTDYVVAITGLGIPNTTATKYIKVADLPYQLLITGTAMGHFIPWGLPRQTIPLMPASRLLRPYRPPWRMMSTA